MTRNLHTHETHGGDGAGTPEPAAVEWVVFESLVIVVLVGLAFGYGFAVWRTRTRTRSRWPIAAPITLGLRALPVTTARKLTRVLRTPWVRIVMHPVIAAVLNAGGLWLLYTTDLFHLMHASVTVHALVHAHIFLAGYVFTASIVGVDPDPHRASMLTRSAVLIAFIAAHQILAKWLYATAPAGFETADAQVGAQLMYYGGDMVDVTIIILLFAGWYTKRRNRAVASVHGAAWCEATTLITAPTVVLVVRPDVAARVERVPHMMRARPARCRVPAGPPMKRRPPAGDAL